MFGKVKTPEPVNAQSLEQSTSATDSERRNRANKGGRGASFLWNADPIAVTNPKPTVMGGN